MEEEKVKKLKKYIDRQEGVISGKENLEELYTIKNFPVFFGCVNTPRSKDIVADMHWAIDPGSGVIQLTKLIPLNILYQAQHVDGCGPTWTRYYHDFSRYILKSDPRTVLEIGGGQGQLAEITTNKLKKLKWIIVEPNPTHPGNDQIEIVKGFFDSKFRLNKKVETVVFSQLLEHIYNPRDFIKSISNFLKPSGKLVFAYPNLTVWLKRRYTNAVNFEHTMFLTNYFVDYLIIKEGFKIKDKRKYKDHSYFYTAVKERRRKTKVLFKNRYKEYKRIFLDFVSYHEDLVNNLNKIISKAKRPIYCFGAHIFTTYLLAFGLDQKKIVSILDNSPTKQGKRLYGTKFKVESPNILVGKGKVYVILKAGVYQQEIKEQLLSLNKNVTILE